MTDAATADAAPQDQADELEVQAPPYNRHPEAEGDGSPPTAVQIPDPPSIGGYALPRPKRVAIDLDRSVITAGLVAALARAQSDIRTVGKTSRNEQRKYDYANADDMIGECRRAFSCQGLAIVSSCYMQDPAHHDPLTVDDQGNATQWLDGLLKGTTLVMYTEPKTREVGILVVCWEQDVVGKRGTAVDKCHRAAETYALGFVSRGLGHMSRAVTPADEDRDREGDDEGAPGRKRGSSKPAARSEAPQQGSTRKVTPAGEAKTEDKLAGLRQSVIDRYTALGRQEWKPWLEVCKTAGLPGPVRVAEATAEALRKLHDYLAEQGVAAEADAAAKASEGA